MFGRVTIPDAGDCEKASKSCTSIWVRATSFRTTISLDSVTALVPLRCYLDTLYTDSTSTVKQGTQLGVVYIVECINFHKRNEVKVNPRAPKKSVNKGDQHDNLLFFFT